MRPFLVLGSILLFACSGGDASGPSRIEIEDSWQGNFQLPSGGTGSLNMTLQETSGSVNGNGNLTGPGGSVAVTITGTYTPPNFALTFSSTGFTDLSLTGVVSQSQMTGQFQGSGFTGTSVTLHRQ